MACLFKVWCSRRLQKCTVISEPVVSTLIAKSNAKMQLEGVNLIFEEDGTAVDDDALQFLAAETNRPKEILMILEEFQSWHSSTVDNLDNSQVEQSAVPVKKLKLSEVIDGNQSSLAFQTPANNSDLESVSQELEMDVEELEHDDHDVAGPSAKKQSLKKCAVSDWSTFSIRWPSKDEPYWELLNEGCRENYLIKIFVQNIVDQMRRFSVIIPNNVFQTVAEQMVKAFPKSFGDFFEGGEVFGPGYATIKRKLRDRNQYLDRFRMGLNKELGNPLTAQKLLKSARAPCSSWQPDAFPEKESLESLQAVEAELLEIAKFYNPDDVSEEEKSTIIFKLEKTYVNQRLFLNTVHNLPHINAVREKWPILLHKEYLFWHYGVLMGQSISALEDAFLENYERIFTLNEMTIAKEEQKQRKRKNVQVEEENDVRFSHYQKSNSRSDICIQTFVIISTHLNEDLDSMFILCESNDVDITELVLPEYPCVIRKGDSDSFQYHLVIDKIELGGTDDLLEAMKMFFASFYVFNRMFPDIVAATLQFLQEYFLRIPSETGSKCRQHSQIQRKILSLFSKLRDIHAPNPSTT